VTWIVDLASDPGERVRQSVATTRNRALVSLGLVMATVWTFDLATLLAHWRT
jgi:hypothetical protein